MWNSIVLVPDHCRFIYFVLNIIIKFSFSKLRQQLNVISSLALGTNFKNYEMAFCWSIFPQYIGMRLLSVRCIYPQNLNFVKTYDRQHNVNVWYL